MRSTLEDWPLLGVRSIQAFAMSIMLGVVYWQLQRNQGALRDHFGVLYMVSVMYPYLIIVDIIETCTWLNVLSCSGKSTVEIAARVLGQDPKT